MLIYGPTSNGPICLICANPPGGWQDKAQVMGGHFLLCAHTRVCAIFTFTHILAHKHCVNCAGPKKEDLVRRKHSRGARQNYYENGQQKIAVFILTVKFVHLVDG